MAARKSSAKQAGGILVFLGSLIYLYVVYTWFTGGAAPSAWLSMASFLAPFVVAFGVFSAVSLFFMGLGSAAGMSGGDEKMMHNLLWKFIMLGAVTFIIIGGTASFYVVLVALLLTYIGGMAGSK